MKGLIVVAMMLASGCAAPSRTDPGARRLPPDHVVLATFTAAVDLEAGTFVIRSTPTAAGRALRTSALGNLDADVTVENNGPAWTDSNIHPCRDGTIGHTWGATVDITNIRTSKTLSGVYAEITSFEGGTGQESCSNDSGPAELDATYGLWSYGLLDIGWGPVSRDWVFKYVGGLKFTFSGRIVGVTFVAVDVNAGSARKPGSSPGSLADNNGLNVVAAVWDPAPSIDFIGYDGAFVRSVATPDVPLYVTTGPNRVWYSTQNDGQGGPSYVGYMRTDGSGEGHSDSPTGLNVVSAIVADATHPDQTAWILYPLDSSNHVVRSYTPGATAPDWSPAVVYVTGDRVSSAGDTYRSIQDANQGNAPEVGPWWELALAEFGDPTQVPTADGSADWMTLGPDGRLYVTASAASTVVAIDISTDPPTVAAEHHVPVGLACAAPSFVASGPGSKLYFSATDSTDGNSVCSMTTGGTFANLGAVTGPGALAINSAGEIWARSWDFSADVQTAIVRIAASGPGYWVGAPGGDMTFPGNVGWFGGKWWAVNGQGLFQFTP